MSRTYRKVLCYTDQGKHSQYFKRLSNKRARRNEDLPDGTAYKKYGLTYDICDYKFIYYTYSEWLNAQRRLSKWGISLDDAKAHNFRKKHQAILKS